MASDPTPPSDEEARKALVEELSAKHGRELDAFVLARVRNPTEANDIVQETYVRMMRVANITTVRAPVAYMFTIALNLCKENHRRKGRERSNVDVDDPLVQSDLAESPSIEQEIDREILTVSMLAHMEHLPPKGQECLWLKFRDGLTYEEIATRKDISVHMVKKYLTQGLATLRKRMRRLGPSDDE